MKTKSKLLLILFMQFFATTNLFSSINIRYCIKTAENNVLFYTSSILGQSIKTPGSYILANTGDSKTYQIALPGNLTRLSQEPMDNSLKITAAIANQAAATGGIEQAGYQSSNNKATYFFKPFTKDDFPLNQPDSIFVVACTLNPSNGTNANKIKCLKYTKDQMTTTKGNANWFSTKGYSTIIEPTVCTDGTDIYPA